MRGLIPAGDVGEVMSGHGNMGGRSCYCAPLPVLAKLLLSSTILAISAGVAHAIDDPSKPLSTTERASDQGSTTEQLLKRMQMMEQRIQMLEGQLKQKQQGTAAAAAPGPGSATPPGKSAPVPSGAAAPPTATGSPPVPADAAKQVAGKPQTPPVPEGPTPTAQSALWHLPPLPGGQPGVSSEKAILGVADSPVPGLSIGAYGEQKFGTLQNPAAGGDWQNGFDAGRVVLLPTYAITPNIIFNAEIEFEHGGAGFDADDKLHGTAEIEQIWIDFKMADAFNWRAPGVDLIPIGYINQHHEPTQFYSVNRPELYLGLIPSTWKAGATSIYGNLADGLSYQVQTSMSLEDFGDDFGVRTEANTVPPFPTGYAPGIDGLSGLAFAQAPIGGFAQLNNAIAVASKLDYAPTFLPGFAGSTSVYYTPNTTPRGAYDQLGNALNSSSLLMFDTEFRYRVPQTGWEFRGEYVRVMFGSPENLRANNDGDPFNNVGKTMYGTSGEVAYHFPLGTFIGSQWEAVPFFRYTYQNLQSAGFAGTDLNSPTGAGQQQFFTTGVAVFPSPQVVLKATYQHVKTDDPNAPHTDYVLGGVGFFF
jgi:hypothetical protein